MNNIIHAMVFHLFDADDDLHSGNVGFRGNTPIYYDPSNRTPQGYLPATQYSGTSSSHSDSSGNETLLFGDDTVKLDTFIYDEPDETEDEERSADYTNKTFDLEYT